MRIILRKATDTSHAIELARLFPAINSAKFGEADREVAIGVGLTIEDFDMHRAVHWFEQVAVDLATIQFVGKVAARAALLRETIHGARFHNGRELRVFVVGEVPGGAVKT